MGRSPNASRQARILFAELLRAPQGWRHGYELSQETGLLSGTLYPLLIRLKDQGLLEARWEEPEKPGRPPRHAYRLTSGGASYARVLLRDAAGPTLKLKLRGAT
jgi:DNA-binding PadR family transcriptional regulator